MTDSARVRRFVFIWLGAFVYVAGALFVGAALAAVPFRYWPIMGAMFVLIIVTAIAVAIYKWKELGE